MRSSFWIFIICLFLLDGARAQSPYLFPEQQLHNLSTVARERIIEGSSDATRPASNEEVISGVGQLMQIRERLLLPDRHQIGNRIQHAASDTLFIVDTMEVSGTWVHQGTIVIANSGILHFSHANATILGDIYLIGEHPQLVADSSTLTIPQAYFYQRILFVTGGGKVIYRNTVVDHSSLSHNILLIDSARLELIKVTNIGFTTNGIYGKSEVMIDGINEAGEYIIKDESTLSFRNAKTILLWHHFPKGSDFSYSFPEGDSVFDYQFNNLEPGVSGINYQISVDSCTNVMWGLMPENGTEIYISDSKIRAIGLWFMGSDTVNVSGLVDYSSYSDFLAPLSDRTLQLSNSEVTTWSLYPMEHAVVIVSGCIVGEVGTGGRSYLMGQQYFCDGSGGYVWASDSSFLINGFSSVSGYVRSQASATLIFAYSSLASGYPSALQNSILMVLQCTLPSEPRALDKAVAWYANISQPFEAYAGALVPITGSAWIDRTNSSQMMDFGSYHLFYQRPGSEEWTEIAVDSLNEKRNEILGTWNTSGLPAGQYLLKLVIHDSWQNEAEAIKGVQLQQGYGVDELDEALLKVYPNPAQESLFVEIPGGWEDMVARMIDMTGRILFEMKIPNEINPQSFEIPLKSVYDGCYILCLTNANRTYFRKVIVD